MAWTKTANIKGEQGRVGTRSTEIFFNNSSNELDGDLKIALMVHCMYAIFL